MILAPPQICAVARAAGFSDTVMVSPGVSEVAAMCAVALRESAGNTDAFNRSSATGDRSYGLWQINLRDINVYNFLMTKFPAIRADEKWLLDPANNAAAAFALYRGKRVYLNLLWYIDTPGPYQERYEANLPTAIAAAALA
jgi:Lysozyme like domain